MKRYIRFDWVIKSLMRDKANYVIVAGFLSELLGQSIQIEEVLETESNKMSLENKFNRVDMLVKDQQGSLIIIELQYETELDYFQRILYGTSQLITQYISEGQPYSFIKKVISVSIAYFDLGVGEDYLYYGTTSFRGVHQGDTLQLTNKQKHLYQRQTIETIYPEYYLIKVDKFLDQVTDTLDQWIYFLKNEMIQEGFTARGLIEAKERLDVLKLPTQQRQAYEIYLDNLRYQNSMIESTRLKGYFEGEEVGYQRGETETKLDIARKLLASMDNDAISKITGLEESVIQSLR